MQGRRKGSIVSEESPQNARGVRGDEISNTRRSNRERRGERQKGEEGRRREGGGRREDQASFRYQLTALQIEGEGFSRRQIRRCCPPSRRRGPLRRLHQVAMPVLLSQSSFVVDRRGSVSSSASAIRASYPIIERTVAPALI